MRPTDPSIPIDTLFFDKVEEAPSGCWEWDSVRDFNGYGQFHLPRAYARERGIKRIHKAHRWSYEYMVAEIPPGLQLDHLCRNRACINPYHLEPVTSAVNSARGDLGRKPQSHCRRGHPITQPAGRTRRCWTCHYERNKARTR